jgi:hypothetical protein
MAAPGRKLELNKIFTDLNLIEGLSDRRPGEPGPGTEPRTGEKQPEQPRETAGDKTMTTEWRRMETADGAGAEALCGVPVCARSRHAGLICRALRWKTDAVCRETAAAEARFHAQADADALCGVTPDGETDSASSGLNRTIYFSSRIQTQPTTRKETHNTTQEKKGKKTQNTVTIRKKLETLA